MGLTARKMSGYHHHTLQRRAYAGRHYLENSFTDFRNYYIRRAYESYERATLRRNRAYEKC